MREREREFKYIYFKIRKTNKTKFLKEDYRCGWGSWICVWKLLSPLVDTRATGLLPRMRSISAITAGVNFEAIWIGEKKQTGKIFDRFPTAELLVMNWYFRRVVRQMKRPGEHNGHCHFLHTMLRKNAADFRENRAKNSSPIASWASVQSNFDANNANSRNLLCCFRPSSLKILSFNQL